MRLIDADLLDPDAEYDDGEFWAYSKRQIDEAPTVQQWIPCSERTPKENGRYLTTNKAWGAYEVDWNAWIDGQWLYQNDQPVAWMPLPEPWNGENNERS